MKIEEKGRRFNKRTVTTYDDPIEYLREKLKQHERGPHKTEPFDPAGKRETLDGAFEKLTRIAENTLHEMGLPFSEQVAKYRDDPDTWVPYVPEKEGIFARSSLPGHIEKLCKENVELTVLAAEIAALAADVIHLTGRFSREGKHYHAYRIGVQSQLLHTYCILSADGKANAGKSRKKSWAIFLATYLKSEHPDKSFSFCWMRIPESYSALTFKGEEIYQDGNSVHFGGDTLRKNSFRTGYW